MSALACPAYREGPVPLLNPQARFILLFSPKSACSSTVIWFLNTLGLANEAQAYNAWPHRYRTEVFNKSPLQQEARRLPLDHYTVLRVVRDPVDRALSSYRHALGFHYANDTIRERLGLDVASQGLSLCEFIDFLELEDLTQCNPHHRIQTHPLERLRPADVTINVSRQDLFTELNRFEAHQGMPVTDFAQLQWLHDVQHTRTPPLVNPAEDNYRTRFKRAQALRGPWPRNLLTEQAHQRLARLYAEDIQRYGSTQARPALPASSTAPTPMDLARNLTHRPPAQPGCHHGGHENRL